MVGKIVLYNRRSEHVPAQRRPPPRQLLRGAKGTRRGGDGDGSGHGRRRRRGGAAARGAGMRTRPRPPLLEPAAPWPRSRETLDELGREAYRTSEAACLGCRAE